MRPVAGVVQLDYGGLRKSFLPSGQLVRLKGVVFHSPDDERGAAQQFFALLPERIVKAA